MVSICAWFNVHGYDTLYLTKIKNIKCLKYVVGSYIMSMCEFVRHTLTFVFARLHLCVTAGTKVFLLG
jgi:hypothetical protein